VSDDPDADIVEIIVRKGCDLPLLFGQRVAFIAGALCVEKLPPALSRIVNGIRTTRNEAIEPQIERYLRPFVGSDCPTRSRPLGGLPNTFRKAC
jgi:hypothetical protein